MKKHSLNPRLLTGLIFRRKAIQLAIGDFEMDIMRTMHLIGYETPGPEIRDRLQLLVKAEVSMSEVYGSLMRLAKLRLISSRMQTPMESGYRARLIYKLEESGKRLMVDKLSTPSKPQPELGGVLATRMPT